MRFVLLLHEDEQVWARATPAERDDHARRHDAFTGFVRERGAVVAGEALSTVAAATTVRRDGGAVVVTDGPYAEVVEQVCGFYVVDLPDLDAVVDAVGLLPRSTVEVRPVVAVDAP